MKNRRLVIETSTEKKKVLNRILNDQGKSLTDWFNDQLEQAAAPYGHFTSDEAISEFASLDQLNAPSVILEKLRAVNWSFVEEDTTYLSHNIHPYPAKYIPQIPNELIKKLSLPGEVVWDPFGGSGTTALEAILLGRQAVSSDINPVALVVGKAKTTTILKEEEEELKKFVGNLKLLAQDTSSLEYAISRHQSDIEKFVPLIPNIEKWFHQHSVNELAYIRWSIETKLNDNCKTIALSVFSKIIIRVSFQDSETRYASKPREVTEGETLTVFCSEFYSTLNKITQLPSFLKHRDAKFILANFVEEKVVENNSVDLIVSSPPYPNATDYHLYHRFRIFWLGYDPRQMATSEIGSHLRHQKEGTAIQGYLDEMKSCLIKMYSSLRGGRYAVLVLGDGVFKGEVFETAELLEDIAAGIGFEFVGIVKRPVHSTKRSFASAARRLMEEKLLVLRKPSGLIDFHLELPPYRLWPYEDKIRKMEIMNLLQNNLIQANSDFSTLTVDALHVDKLRRLTFTHGFSADSHFKELTWQSILENGDALDAKSNRKDPKYVLHGVHPYKGKFYPQLAKSLFNIAGIQSGQKILDPFCGSGTVLLESQLNGIHSTGFDLNPLAIKIARVKTTIPKVDPIIVDMLIREFLKELKLINYQEENRQIFNAEALPELESWFAGKVLNKLGYVFRIIDGIPDQTVAEFFKICVSSIVRDISQQDPRDLRIRRREVPLEDAPVQELLEKKIIDQWQRLKKFNKASKCAPNLFGKATVIEGDCRAAGTFKAGGIAQNSIDAVVTSPPYATALPYIDTDRLSILLLLSKNNRERVEIERRLIGARDITTEGRKTFESIIESGNILDLGSALAINTIKRVYELNRNADVGFRRKNMASLLLRYYKDMYEVMNNLHFAVRPGGNLFFVIGDNLTTAGNVEVNIQSGKILAEMGQSIGWNLKEVIPITVTQESKIHNKNGITENDIIWFQK